MTGEGRKQSAAEEMARAREELVAAEKLLDLKMARIAATRIYYACFHASRALLYSEGLEPKTHEGVQHLLNLNFVKPGRMKVSNARLFSRLQKFREEADYNETFVPDEHGTREDLQDASAFVQAVNSLLPDLG